MPKAAIKGQIEVGDLVRDKRSQLTGIVEVISDYLYQCRQIAVRPEGLTKENKLFEATWFDEPALERVKANVVQREARIMEAGVPVSGGPPRPRHITTNVRPAAGPNPYEHVGARRPR